MEYHYSRKKGGAEFRDMNQFSGIGIVSHEFSGSAEFRRELIFPSVPEKINPLDSPGFAVLIREANEGGLKPGVCSGLILSGALSPI